MNAELADEFSEQAGRFRQELLAFCYQMLGSAQDAEDVVQETYLNAWRSYGTFEGRSSLRTWLYRIAARACLKALERDRHQPLPSGLGGPSPGPDGPIEAEHQEMTWLQPFPSDPASVVEDRATMRLALIAALQHLPPRQRAVLILRDVLQWRAAEVGELLDMSTTAVNSALQRARAQLPLPDDAAEPAEPERRAMLDKYVTAFETADVTGLVAVLTEDASWEMPPIPTWFAGRDTVVAFLAGRQRIVGGMPAIPAAANGQPAFAFYARDTQGAYHPHALHVLTLTKAGISRIVSFQDPGLFPLFGLPPAVSS